MTYKTTTNLKEFDLTGMTLEAVKEFAEWAGVEYELIGLFDRLGYQCKPLRIRYDESEVWDFTWMVMGDSLTLEEVDRVFI